MSKMFRVITLAVGLLAAATPAMAQYYEPSQQQQMAASRLSRATLEAVDTVGSPWYGERIDRVARHILELGPYGAEVVSRTLADIGDDDDQRSSAAQQVAFDVNQAVSALQQQSAQPGIP